MGTFIIYTQNCYNLFNITTVIQIFYQHGTFIVIILVLRETKVKTDFERRENIFSFFEIWRRGSYKWTANRCKCNNVNSTEIHTKNEMNWDYKGLCFEVRRCFSCWPYTVSKGRNWKKPWSILNRKCNNGKLWEIKNSQVFTKRSQPGFETIEWGSDMFRLSGKL